MQNFGSITQLRNVIHTVKSNHDFQGKDGNGDPIYRHVSTYPTLKFHGTVKCHGTNAGIVKYKDRIEFQSKENVLSLTSDNAGFHMNMSAKNLDFLFEGMEFNDNIAVFGEWCGGSIQKSVALNQLPKMLIIFKYVVDGVPVEKVVHDNAQGIYHIEQFPTYDVDIDFNTPEISQNEIIRLTIAVEDECPVGKYFGVTGIGEGIVFVCTTDPKLRFKSKGEKHSVSKVKVLAPIDIEVVNNINEFVEYAVTENRLEQGFGWMQENHVEQTMENTGVFLKWVANDVIKEETDTLVKNQLDMKKVGGKISQAARVWYFQKLDKICFN